MNFNERERDWFIANPTLATDEIYRLRAINADMLAALEDLADAVQSGVSYADDTPAGKALGILSGRSGTKWLSNARAAIAKARGE